MFFKNKIKNLFVISAIFIKFLNSNTISVKIMVNELKPLNINLGDTFNPLASPSAGAPALNYGDVNIETTSPGEVKGLFVK